MAPARILAVLSFLLLLDFGLQGNGSAADDARLWLAASAAAPAIPAAAAGASPEQPCRDGAEGIRFINNAPQCS